MFSNAIGPPERISYAPVFAMWLSQVTPSLQEYRHNDVTHCVGADVRTLPALLLSSIVVPIVLDIGSCHTHF